MLASNAGTRDSYKRHLLRIVKAALRISKWPFIEHVLCARHQARYRRGVSKGIGHRDTCKLNEDRRETHNFSWRSCLEGILTHCWTGQWGLPGGGGPCKKADIQITATKEIGTTTPDVRWCCEPKARDGRKCVLWGAWLIQFGELVEDNDKKSGPGRASGQIEAPAETFSLSSEGQRSHQRVMSGVLTMKMVFKQN